MVDRPAGEARRPAPQPGSPGARLFIALQHLIPQHALSRAVHRIARCRAVPVKNALIRAFVRSYHPRLDEAAEPDPLRYASFNEFFTRALRPGARPIDAHPGTLVSPVDGTVSQIGDLDALTMIQAKGRDYQLGALLGAPAQAPERQVSKAAEWTRRLAGGAYATLYLAPYNYHRIHMPIAAELKAAWYVPGRLFSVNATTAAAVSGLFARNERVVCLFESSGGMPFAMVLVGALFVGSITTRWHGDVTPCRPREARELGVPGVPAWPATSDRPGTPNRPGTPGSASPAAAAYLDQGAEMGRFNMGSTVILIFPPHALRFRPELAPGSRITVGQAIAQLSMPR